MTPREYVDQVARPNLDELADEPDSIRYVLNVVHSIDALAARIYFASGGTDRRGHLKLRDDLASINVDFRIIRDLAKAINTSLFRMERL